MLPYMIASMKGGERRSKHSRSTSAAPKGNAAAPTEPIQLVALLGNPGSQYRFTRHNVAWMMSDELTTAPVTAWKEKFHGRFLKGMDGGGSTTLLMPETFMNRSGRSVQAALAFFSLASDQLVVVHDDLETPFGIVELAWGGGHRGHNGLRSVSEALSGAPYWRLRVGIGRPPAGRKPGDWVLERFSAEEEPFLPQILAGAAGLLKDRIQQPHQERRTILNR